MNTFDVSIEYGEIKKEVALGAEIEALRENAVAQLNMLRQKDEAMRYVTAGKEKFAAGSGNLTSAMNIFQSTLQNDRVAIGRIEQQVTNLSRFANLDEAEVKRMAIDEIIDTALAILEDQIAGRNVEITRITDPRATRRHYGLPI